MSVKLAKKEYVDSKIKDMKRYNARVSNTSNQYVHVIVRFETMFYDKGVFYIFANANGYPYVGIVTYNKTSATLKTVYSVNDVNISLSYVTKESNYIRIVLKCPTYSVINIQGVDYLETAVAPS